MAKAPSTKRLLIDKTNSTVVIITAVAAFIFMFSLVATKTLTSQWSYQNRVITAKKLAVSNLKSDTAATDKLKASYQTFVGSSTNVLGGDPAGNGPQDGDNAQIILDALPSSYDFPALATSLDNMLSADGLEINSITGVDDEVAQSANTVSGAPQAVPIPFTVSVTGNYDTIQQLIGQFEHSIRPFQIQTLGISGTDDKLMLDISAQTFYQPAKTFKLGSTVVK